MESMSDLTIVITSKNEPYLERTIDDVLDHSEMGVKIFAEEDSGIGQRAMLNKLARQVKTKYLMKLDAHCSLSQGFDRVLLSKMEDNMIMAPYLFPLDVKEWQVKPSPKTSAYCFDTNLVMQYHTEAENNEPVNETMCLQGSAWLMTVENYWKWNVCDESLGSWGMQGTELGISAWTNGGKCVTNKLAYYGHLFREKEEDFPYKRDKDAIIKTRDIFKERFLNKKLIPIVERFNFPCDWTKEFINTLK